jgi:hypothetical protein
MNGELPMRTLKTFEKIAVKKKPINKYDKDWKITRKLQRKGKRVMQEKVYA